MKELNIKEATKRYNDLMDFLCCEYNTIGTNFSENTENWNLRDMVSECQYMYDCCFEYGNAQNEGQYPEYLKYTEEDILNKKKFDYVTNYNEGQKELHKEWLSKTRRLRNFVKKYAPYVKGMKCATGHCSFYDN